MCTATKEKNVCCSTLSNLMRLQIKCNKMIVLNFWRETEKSFFIYRLEQNGCKHRNRFEVSKTKNETGGNIE